MQKWISLSRRSVSKMEELHHIERKKAELKSQS